MEQAHELIRPWRRATIAVSVLAALEFAGLAVIALVVLGNPLGRQLRESAAAAATPPKRSSTAAAAKRPALPRDETSVMVLNGNGRAGAAHAAAARVHARGYVLGDVGNAQQLTPHTVVMYRPGYAAEGRRLGRDLHVRLVRPLDGMRPRQLMGAHLVLIVGT
jgi:LytR cell envelope-related transcriptional attenuator